MNIRIVKNAINKATQAINALVPEKQPRFPLTQVVDEVFRDLEKHVKIEAHRNKAYSDNNFLRLIQTTRKTLIMLMDEDPIYHHWFAYTIQEFNKRLNQK